MLQRLESTEEKALFGANGTKAIILTLDPSAQQAITYLFPKKRGETLLQAIFSPGEIALREIPDHGLVSVAMSQVPSFEYVARQLGWSKDTVLRYFAILEALQLLQRFRHGEYTKILLPLTPWHFSEKALSALDALLVEDAARKKLQQLARSVKERCLLLYGSPSSEQDSSQIVLKKRLSPSKRLLLQLRAEHLKLRADTKETTPQPLKKRHARRTEAKAVAFHNKRAEVVALPATLTIEEWKTTLEYFHYKCAYCGINDYEVLEHIIPLTSGGGTTRSNCVPACVQCNSIKGDRHPSMLSPSSAIARATRRIQTYLKTRKTGGGGEE